MKNTNLQGYDWRALQSALAEGITDDTWFEVDGYWVCVTPTDYDDNDGGLDIAMYRPGSTTEGECDIYVSVDKNGDLWENTTTTTAEKIADALTGDQQMLLMGLNYNGPRSICFTSDDAAINDLKRLIDGALDYTYEGYNGEYGYEFWLATAEELVSLGLAEWNGYWLKPTALGIAVNDVDLWWDRDDYEAIQ